MSDVKYTGNERCPFCGHDTITCDVWDGWLRGESGWIGQAECADCGATGPRTLPDADPDVAHGLAIDAWNERATNDNA